MKNELELHYNLKFDRSRKEAFEYIQQVKRRKEFMTIVDETTITYPVKGDNLKGLGFMEVTHFLGFDMKLNYEIVEFIKGYTIVTACNDGPFFPRMSVTLIDGDQNSCTGDVDVKLNTGVLKWIPRFLLKPTIEAIVKPILKRLVKRVNGN